MVQNLGKSDKIAEFCFSKTLEESVENIENSTINVEKKKG